MDLRGMVGLIWILRTNSEAVVGLDLKIVKRWCKPGNSDWP